MHDIPHEHFAIWYRVRISEGARQYLVCEVDTFIVAYECERRGKDLMLRQDGITHIGISEDDCMNLEFMFADDGEILGCMCVDKLYEGPRRTCNHTIKTSQTDIIAMIKIAMDSPKRREHR